MKKTMIAKKMLLLTVAIGVLCAMTGVACAEQPRFVLTPEVTAVDMEQLAATGSIKVYTRTTSGYASEMITVYQEQPDGSYSEGTSYPVRLATVIYQYKVHYDLATRKFIGGSVSKDGYPKVSVDQNVSSDLAVTAVHMQDYSDAYVSAPNAGENYSVYIVGGYAAITYNSELWRHLDGTVTPGGRTTVNIGYYLNKTGTLEDLTGN